MILKPSQHRNDASARGCNRILIIMRLPQGKRCVLIDAKVTLVAMTLFQRRRYLHARSAAGRVSRDVIHRTLQDYHQQQLPRGCKPRYDSDVYSQLTRFTGSADRPAGLPTSPKLKSNIMLVSPDHARCWWRCARTIANLWLWHQGSARK